MTISEHISTLLHEHECVIIPDFGGFIVKDSSASFIEHNESFSPPGATAQFHMHLRNNDGVLIQSIMEHQSLSYSDAAELVNEFTNECKQQLKETKSTILPGIGKIYIDEENRVQFSSTSTANFNTQSFGLPIVKAEKLKRTALANEAIKSTLKKRKVSPLAITFTAAASVVALLLATSLFFLHNGTEAQQQFVRTSLSPIGESLSEFSLSSPKPAEVTVKEKEPPATAEIEAELVTPIAIEDDETETPIDVVPMDKNIKRVIPTTTSDQADFHVVIGMFQKESNAQDRYNEALNLGYTNAELKQGRKYLRVVVPYSRDDATWVEAVGELRETIEPEAWIWQTLYN